jgi:hypothetical protein
MTGTMMAETEVPDPPKLITADRCDVKCPAQAMVRFRYGTDQLLDFCGHHADSFAISLLASGCRQIEDKRDC